MRELILTVHSLPRRSDANDSDFQDGTVAPGSADVFSLRVRVNGILDCLEPIYWSTITAGKHVRRPR